MPAAELPDLSRRNMLRLGAGAAALWAAGGLAGCHRPGRGDAEPSRPARDRTAAKPQPGKTAAAARPFRIGVQLYSVRGECAKDLPGVLAALGKMGYEGVEFAGYYQHTAAELRKMLDDNGLQCAGTHTGLETLTGAALGPTVEFNQILGNKFLIVPSLPRERFASIAALEGTAKLLTGLANAAKPQGMHVGYHAHANDFQPVEGQIPWDVLFTNAGQDVVMQLDTGNCLAGGGDPLATLQRYSGRALTIHLKEHGGPKGAVIGEGDVNWRAILAECRASRCTEWYIVEQEEYAAPPLESVRQCLLNLRKMLA